MVWLFVCLNVCQDSLLWQDLTVQNSKPEWFRFSVLFLYNYFHLLPSPQVLFPSNLASPWDLFLESVSVLPRGCVLDTWVICEDFLPVAPMTSRKPGTWASRTPSRRRTLLRPRSPTPTRRVLSSVTTVDRRPFPGDSPTRRGGSLRNGGHSILPSCMCSDSLSPFSRRPQGDVSRV